MTFGIYAAMKWYAPAIPEKHVKAQLKTILPNLLLVLPAYQATMNYLMTETSWTKVKVFAVSNTDVGVGDSGTDVSKRNLCRCLPLGVCIRVGVVHAGTISYSTARLLSNSTT